MPDSEQQAALGGFAGTQAGASDVPRDFAELAASRRRWIDQILRPWCRAAALRELGRADVEWFDIAGRADQLATLWTWAWERFPDLVHPEMAGLEETHRIRVTLKSGDVHIGFPDGRASIKGMLVLLDTDPHGATLRHGPFAIDQIASAVRDEDRGDAPYDD